MKRENKSKYLEGRRNEIDNETAFKVRKIESEICRQTPSGPSDPTPYWIGGGIVGILLWIFTGLFFVGSIAFALIGFGAKVMTENMYQDEIRALNLSKRVRTDNAKAEGKRCYQQETRKYQEATLKARKRYGKLLTSGKGYAPMVNWMAAQFDNEIRFADRRPHIREVTAPLYFIVEEDKIRARVHKAPVEKSESTQFAVFDYTIRGFTHVPNYLDQVGLAQALALILEHVIIRRYPYDPSDRTRYPAKIHFDANDNEITVTYVAANGSYRHPQKL